MMKLSTGQDSTLGTYLGLAAAVFGESSHQVRFIKQKIAESPRGADEEVITDERQMLYLLVNMPEDNSLEDLLS